MGRYYYNQRDVTEDYRQISLTFLRKKGCLEKGDTLNCGILRWSRGLEETGSMLFCIEKNDNEMHGTIRLFFTQTKHDTGEKTEFDYKIPLIATKCNYGGIRWWFLDPCSKNRIKCLVLFMQSNGYFTSRKNLNLAYESQNKGIFARRLSYLMGINASKAIALKESIKYPFRNGKPTRKLKRFLKLSNNIPSPEEQKYALETLFKLK